MRGNKANAKTLIFRLVFIILCLILMIFSISRAYASDELPPGFEDFLEENETTLVTLQFGNNTLAEAVATFDDNEITLEDPDKVLAELKPYIKKSAQSILLSALSDPLATNIDRACQDGPQCGFIKPNILGVIFDRNNYKLSIFINPIYLLNQKTIPTKYLKDSTAGISMLNLFQFGASGNNDENHSLSMNHNGFLGYQNWHIDYKTNYTYSVTPEQETINQFQFRDLDLNWRHKQYYASFGLQDTIGTLIIPTFQIVGASFQTNSDLITNLNEQIATPVEVNIIVPSYVDVYRNNTLIDTQYFPPGNYFLDTRGFPSGAYFLKLDIRTLNNQRSTKEVYFIKTSALPLLSLPNYYISYGRLAEIDSSTVFPTLTNLNVLSLEAKQRLHKLFGIGEHITLFNESQGMAELSFMAELTHMSMVLSGALSNFGDTGLGFSVAGSFYSVVLNTYLRQIWIKNTENSYINEYFEDTDTSNTNIGTSIAFNWHDINFNAGLSYAYVDEEFQHNIEFGATKYFSFGPYNDFSIALTLDASQTNKSIFLQFTWNIGSPSGWYGAIGAEGQLSKESSSTIQREQNLKFNVGKEINTAYTSSDIGTSTQIDANNQYYSQYGSTSNPYFDALQQFDFAQSKDNGDTFNYNLKFATSLAYSPSTYWGVSHSDETSGVLVRVNSDIPSQYTVYVNGKPDKVIDANSTYYLPLTSYETHNIQIQTHEVTLSVPHNDLDVVVYPGNVQSIIRSAKPALLLMGNFVTENGALLTHATISGGLEDTNTDDEGFAQIDVLEGEPLTLTLQNGSTCEVTTNNLQPEDGFVYLDQIICH
ncbi:TcfC E-set like domain-containing protein [Fangia hongkongensis]|uniref:TcfC E-set like domain-containing protein n=1 Tax=Fangia hongkongensis TaxID=270495 RepID=UPI00035C7463|nr:TcfC E-set like domain-containing protein [Fangia hongkongensis]MBK2125019.1 TcfC E-set like domain-containing protein [Fangia hongkongensis]